MINYYNFGTWARSVLIEHDVDYAIVFYKVPIEGQDDFRRGWEEAGKS